MTTSEITASEKDPPKKMVGAVAKAIEILSYLNAEGKDAGIVQIADDLGIHKSTCLNILRTLVYFDVLEVDPKSRRYRLGLGLAALAQGAFDPRRSLSRARAEMMDLAHRYDVSISLWRRTSFDRMSILTIAEGSGGVRLSMNVGHRLPVAGGAMGRVLAAFGSIPEDQLHAQFSSVRWQRTLTWETFQKQVEEARKQGWFADHGTFVRNATTVSVPVPNRDESPIMVCSASFVERQFPKSAVTGIARSLQQLAQKIAILPGIN